MRAETANPTREQRTAYEVHRARELGPNQVARPPRVEEFAGLDRARLAALGYALDGPTSTGDRFTGRVEVHRLFSVSEKVVSRSVIDVLDERVAFRLLNELALPHADSMSVPVERLQEEAILPFRPRHPQLRVAPQRDAVVGAADPHFLAGPYLLPRPHRHEVRVREA